MAKFVKKVSKTGVGPSVESVEGGIKEIDFGVTPSAPSKRAPSKYPLIEGESVSELVDHLIELKLKFDAVDGPFKASKEEMKKIGFPQFFKKNRGKVEAPSSMIAEGKKGEVRISFQDRFIAGNKELIEKALGKDVAGQWFRQSWKVVIDGNAIPPDKAPALIRDLKEVVAKHDSAHAVEFKTDILPIPDFAAKRHFVFDPETNLLINQVVPQVASVTPKKGK